MANELRQTLQAKTLNHPSSLRNPTHSSRHNKDLSTTLWDPNNDINFQRLYPFGQHGCSFIYYPSTISGKKFLSEPGFYNFIEFDGNTGLLRVNIPESS